MKFVSLKANGMEVFVNPENVLLISSPKNGIIGSAVMISATGLAFEIDGSPSEVREKLEGSDKPIF
jgi:hypothetical protein